jgi:hypothetical protein
MTHRDRPPRRLARWLAGLALLTACQREPLPRYGAVALELHVAATVDEIRFVLAGPSGLRTTDALGANAGTATTTVEHLPAGGGYLVTAEATADNGARDAAEADLSAHALRLPR